MIDLFNNDPNSYSKIDLVNADISLYSNYMTDGSILPSSIKESNTYGILRMNILLTVKNLLMSN